MNYSLTFDCLNFIYLSNRSGFHHYNLSSYNIQFQENATLCIKCKKFVNKHQEALLCDGCNTWQHRTCSSGVSRDMYRNAVKFGEDIPWSWRCKPCSTLHDLICLFTSNCCCVIFLSTALWVSPKKSDRAQGADQRVESPFLEPPSNSNQKSFRSSVKSCNISEINWKYGQTRSKTPQLTAGSDFHPSSQNISSYEWRRNDFNVGESTCGRNV